MEKPRRKLERTRRPIAEDQSEKIEVASSVTLEYAMQQYVNAKVAERTAPRTLKDYQRHFRYMNGWLSAKYPEIKLRDVATEHLREYITWMTNEKEQYSGHPHRPKKAIIGLSPETVNIRIRSMKAFFNWCYKEGYIAHSPTDGIKQQKVDYDRISAFNEGQIRRLLASPDRNTYVGFRDYVIMVTLLDTGLRISELFGLRRQDVDFEQMTLTVPWQKAKTRKTRTVPLSKSTAKLIAELLRENEDFGADADHLFYSAVGNIMDLAHYDVRLKEYGKHAGVEGVRVSAHTFRHTFALHWIKSGGDPFSLQKMLGHTDMSMVRRYVRLSDGDVKEKHMQFSPIQTLLKH